MSAVSLPSNPSWKLKSEPRWRLEEHASTSPWPVRFTVGAARALRAQPLDDQVEHGGWLFGRFSEADGFTIEDAAPAVVTATRSNVILDFDELRRLGKLHNGKLEVLGSWHSHPVSRDPKPSRRDLSAYLAMWDAFKTAGSEHPALGVIAVRGRTGWNDPQLTAHVLWRDAEGKPDVAIAPVEMPPGWTI